jgi:predicted transposase YbfD/YdcC
MATQARRRQRLQQRLVTLATRQQRVAQQIATLHQQQTALQQWHDQLATENTGLIAPLPLVVRVDAGFRTDDNLTWLIEMGYAVVTKVHNSQTATRLRRGIAADVTWDTVGRNAVHHIAELWTNRHAAPPVVPAIQCPSGH